MNVVVCTRPLGERDETLEYLSLQTYAGDGDHSGVVIDRPSDLSSSYSVPINWCDASRHA